MVGGDDVVQTMMSDVEMSAAVVVDDKIGTGHGGGDRLAIEGDVDDDFAVIESTDGGVNGESVIFEREVLRCGGQGSGVFDVVAGNAPMAVQVWEIFFVFSPVGKGLFRFRQNVAGVGDVTAEVAEIHFWSGAITHAAVQIDFGGERWEFFYSAGAKSVLNGMFELDFPTFASVIEHDDAAVIDEERVWPVFVGVQVPNFEVGIEDHGIRNTEFGNRLLDILLFAFDGKLWRVNADDREAQSFVLSVEGFDGGNGSDAIPTGVGPNVDEHWLAAQALHCSRCRIQPDKVGWKFRGVIKAKATQSHITKRFLRERALERERRGRNR